MAKSLLPTVADDDALIGNVKILMSRILNETLSFFRTAFSDFVIKVIQHKCQKQMSLKSQIVSTTIQIITS